VSPRREPPASPSGHPPGTERPHSSRRRGKPAYTYNWFGLEHYTDVDGALVGGASLKADSFLKLVHFDKQ